MTFLMFIAIITQIGNLLADIALAILDPRIRMS
jgi:peptide/nickel transport system permease protein